MKMRLALLVLVLSSGVAWADFKGPPLGGSATIWPPQGTTVFGPTSKIWPNTQPDGTQTNCAGTTSNCVQELLNAMQTKGPTDIYGGGGSVGSNAIVAFTGTLALPLQRNSYIHLHGGGLFQVGTPAPGTPSVTIDSMVESSLWCEGCQIAGATGAASGSMPAVLIDPHTVLPIEGLTMIGASRIDLGNTGVQWSSGQSDACVKATLAHAGITRNFIDAIEINGGGPSPTTTGCQYGYMVTGYPGGGSPNAYVQNLHRFGFVHLFSDVGVSDGANGTDGAAVFQNIYDVGGIEPRGASSVGVVAFGHGSVFRVGGVDNLSGTVQTCAAAANGASDTHMNIGCWSDGGTGAIPVGINFVAGADNNTGWIRPVTTNGGSITRLVQDGGVNNIAWRGATAYSKGGVELINVDGSGAVIGGVRLGGTAASNASTGNAINLFTPALGTIAGVDHTVAVFVQPTIGGAFVNTDFVAAYNMNLGSASVPIPSGTLGNLSGYEANITSSQAAADSANNDSHLLGGTFFQKGGGGMSGISLDLHSTTVAPAATNHAMNVGIQCDVDSAGACASRTFGIELAANGANLLGTAFLSNQATGGWSCDFCVATTPGKVAHIGTLTDQSTKIVTNNIDRVEFRTDSLIRFLQAAQFDADPTHCGSLAGAAKCLIIVDDGGTARKIPVF